MTNQVIPDEAVEAAARAGAAWGVASKSDDGWVWVMRDESEARNAVRENTKLVRKVDAEWVDAQ